MAHFFNQNVILNSRRKYKVSWNINGQQAATAQLRKESEFKIYVVEKPNFYQGSHSLYPKLCSL
jgi:hypothetical protein